MSLEHLHLARAAALTTIEDGLRLLDTRLDRPGGLRLLLGRLGWRLDGLTGVDPAALLSALRTVRATLRDAVDASSDVESAAAGQTLIDAVDRLGAEWASLEQAIATTIDAGVPGGLDPSLVQAFLADLQEYLVCEWLLHRAPAVLHVADAIGLLRWDAPPPLDTGGPEPIRVRHAVPRRTLPLLRAVSLATDPLALLHGETNGGLDAVQKEIEHVLGELAGRLDDLGTGVMQVRLRPDGIEVFGFDPPLLSSSAMPVTLDLPLPGTPAAACSVTLAPESLRLRWSDLEATVGGAFTLLQSDGFTLVAGGPPGTDEALPSLTLALGAPPEAVFAGGLGVVLPASWLADASGASLQIRASGSVGLRLGESVRVVVDLLEASLSGLRIGGSSGPVVESALLRVRDLQFPLHAPPGIEIGGAMLLGDARIEVTAQLQNERFEIRSVAEVDLPGGLRFEPVGGAPVLSLQVAWGATGVLDAAFAGRVRIPGAGGLEAVTMTGSLTLSLAPEGVTIDAVAVAAAIDGHWTLPGGIVVREAGLSLSYAAGVFAVDLTGRVRIGEGDVALEQARLAFGDDAVSLEVVQSVTDVSIDALARLRTGTMHLEASATAAGAVSGSLRVEQGTADIIRSGSDWLIEIESLSASISAGTGAFQLQIASGLVWFARPFAGADADRIGAVVDALVLDVGPGGASVSGGMSLAAPVDLWETAGFRVEVGAGTGCALAAGSGGAPRLSMTGNVTFHVSEEALADMESVGPVRIGLAGTVTLVMGPPPALEFEQIDVAIGPGTFRLGGADALTLSNAHVELKGLDRLGRATAADPFEVRIGGRLQLADDGPALTLVDSAFVFSGGALPAFQPGGIAVESGSFGDDLPFRITGASFRLADPTVPFPASLHPSNLILGMSVGLELPIGGGQDAAGFMARADDLVVDLSTSVPTVSLDGLGLGVDGLVLGPVQVTGLLYVGGLGNLASLPAPISGDLERGTRPFFVAGKVGGSVNGTKLNVLLAMRPDRPLGACFDVAVDGGIPIVYGFTVNGISGGVSFANQPGNPCDLKAYLTFPDNPADPPQLDDTGWQPDAGEYAFEGGRAVTPATGCDCECPPPSMNPLCQPHPDGARYPGRAILKFSAIPEATLDQWGVLDLFDQATAGVDALVESILDHVRARLDAIVPTLPDDFELPAGMPGELVALARDPVGAIITPMRPRLRAALADAGSAMRERFIETMAAGIECPDVTLQVTGTFSYTGVGYFLTVTGGVNVSTTGTAGVIGTVNLFGIPIGRLRAFVSATDAQGLPQQSFCGDLDLSFGPFDFGRVCLTATAPSIERIVLEALVQHLPALGTIGGTAGPALLDSLLDEVDAWPGSPAERIVALDVEGALAIVNRLSAQGGAHGPDVQAWLGGLFATLWESFDPTIDACGVVQPKVFGLPVMGEVATLAVSIRKDRLTATTTVPLSQALLSLVAGSYAMFVMPTDYLTLSVSCAFPDPIGVGISTFLGVGGNPRAFADAVTADVDRVLEETLFAIGLRVCPFGLELARAQGRLLLPDLIQYPAPAWAPPDGRAELLAACLEHDLLVQPTWTGDLHPLGHPGSDLRRDWFPHGGLVGAGVLRLPRLLTDAPPLDLVGRVLENDDVLDRLGAASTLIGEYLTQTTDVGAMAFYVPAPSPPAGSTGTLLDRLGHLAEHAQTGAVRADLFFCSGDVAMPLFGIEMGHMACRIEAPGPGEPGRFVFEGQFGQGWLADLVGQVAVSALVETPPPLPVQLYAGVAQGLVSLAIQGQLTQAHIEAAVAEAAAGHVQDPDRRADVQARLAGAFTGIPVTGPASAQQSGLALALADAMAGLVPKVALEATASGLDLPPPLAGLLSVTSVRVVAYSPFFDPDAGSGDVFARARRLGGVALEVTGASFDAAGWKAAFDHVALAVAGGSGGVPLVSGSARASSVDLPGLDLERADLSFANSHPVHARLDIRARSLDLGWGRIVPAPGAPAVRLSMDAFAGRAAVSPARLEVSQGLGITRARVNLHGGPLDGPATDDFSFSLTGPWSASLQVHELRLREPATGRTWIASDVAGARLAGNGTAATSLEGQVSFAIDSVGPVVILGIQVVSQVTVGVSVRFHAELDGFEEAITARATGGCTWHGRSITFDTGAIVVDPPSVGGLLQAARQAVLSGFREHLLSFDAFAEAVTGGWVEWHFDPASLAALLTRVYGITAVNDVVAALGRLPIGPAQAAQVLDRLFTFVPHADLPAVTHLDTWIGHVDQVQHGDMVMMPHVDEYVGVHGDSIMHTDVPEGHADVAPVHGDVAASVHLDTTAQIHIDVQTELHGDISGIGHVDTPRGPHVDVPTFPHGDGHVPPHGDLAGLHTDVAPVPHGDVSAKPHADVGATAHGDTSSPHFDGPAPPPHVDMTTHGDVPLVHLDLADAHVDTVVHMDVPGVHFDVGTRPHGDSGGFYRSPVRMAGHGDAPAVPHGDRAAVPHQDSVTALVPHLDVAPRGHGDAPAPHVDTGLMRPDSRGPIIPHADREGATVVHGDATSVHLDRAATPHGDAPQATPHVDRAPVPHVDTARLSHLDTGRSR